MTQLLEVARRPTLDLAGSRIDRRSVVDVSSDARRPDLYRHTGRRWPVEPGDTLSGSIGELADISLMIAKGN